MRLLRYGFDRARHPQRYAQLAGLLQSLSLDRAQLLERQRRDLAGIIDFARSHTDFYAARLAGLPSAQALAHDPTRLPVLAKQDVLDHMDRMLVRGIDRGRVKVGHTGGSTGKPMAFYYDDAKHELMRAGMMRGFMMSGWRPGQKVLYFWGAARDLAQGGVFARYGRRVLDTGRAIAAVEYSDANLRDWAVAVQAWRPALLYGYASALAELARFVVDHRLRMPASLIGVYATAETLHDWQRELMRQAFGCKVFNQYGCREVPNIAWECRAGNMHVFADMVYLESLPGDDAERLLVTSLTDRLMPFIRYDLGDSGRLLDGDCACGLPLPMMQMGMCRHNDLVCTRSGKRIHPAYFNRLLYGLTQVRQYQWVQTAPDRLQLNLVSAAPLPSRALETIETQIRRDLDPQMTLEVNYLDAIARTLSGKHRFVIGLPPVDDTAPR